MSTHDFFEQLLKRFEKRGNTKGVDILADTVEHWNARGNLSEKQAVWISRNAEMHNIPLSQDLQEAVDHWLDPQPTAASTPQLSNSQVGLDAALVTALTTAIQALNNTLVVLNGTIDRLDR